MTLKIQIVKDGEVIWEAPLTPTTIEIDHLRKKCREITRIFEALSNETRIMMLMKMMDEYPKPISFTEIMKMLDANPKIIWENIRRLSSIGLLERNGKGGYRCSNHGRIIFTTLTLALTKLMELMEDLGGEINVL
ncbi:MAG: winged helix-turn-helix domain-containing protein [Candidatus Methanomethylicia archaeon]